MRYLLERLGDDSRHPTLITVRGIGAYLTCHRAWWLADVLAYAPDDEGCQARQILARRIHLAQRLAAAGGVMIATAIIIMVLGLLLGSG
jgi:hypothetical protein